MDWAPFISIAIAVIVLLAFLKLLVSSMKYIFYTLIIVFALIFIFGISYTQLLHWLERVLTWVF